MTSSSSPSLDDAPRKRHALALFAGLPRHYDRAGATLSFGQDPRWRAALVHSVVAGPDERVLDVATGTGMVAAAVVRRTGCRVTALDQSAQMLGGLRARLAADPALAQRIEPVAGQAEALPFPDASFDALTFTYLLRYVEDPAATLRELARVVKPGGTVGMVEFAVPPRRVLRAAWRLYTRLVMPALGRLLSRDWQEVGAFLGPSIEGFYARFPLTRLAALWQEAGLADVRVRRMSFGAGIVMTAVRAADERP
ncbi:MAG TPA: ubiquinone/menaquinone biosynthesis methyltransferase [Conexibacter sp.]|jgi:demethylmenaquinone methyltransferase/2-methoxy-6-polyprenyl-1,4-benzoquinol methylase|nr:ubiquinone/menaquinone biosynthesis methyltransferase [Conexibacter sp.]